MQSDTSAFETLQSPCVEIIDQNNVIVYHTVGTTVTESKYALFGNKYIETARNPRGEELSERLCYSVSDFNAMPSKFDALSPIYDLMITGTLIFITYMVYSIFIKPFLKRGL